MYVSMRVEIYVRVQLLFARFFRADLLRHACLSVTECVWKSWFVSVRQGASKPHFWWVFVISLERHLFLFLHKEVLLLCDT